MSEQSHKSSNKLLLPHVFVGSNIGYIKGVHFHKKIYQNLNTISDNDKPSRDMGISCMCWANGDESSIYAGRLDGNIIQYDVTKDSCGLLNFTNKAEDGQLKSIKAYENNFLSAHNNGVVKIYTLGENLSSDINPSLVINSNSDGENKNLQCMDYNPFVPNMIVTGGNENSLKIWDISAPEKPIFTAKNVKNNWLNLRVPVWVTKAQFYSNSNKVICATGYGKVRLYDPSASQRRPVMEVNCGEHPLTGFCVRPNSDFNIYVGDTTGFIMSVDVRKKATLKSFRGSKGGITDIVAHSKYPIFTVSSVDRFVYCYDPDKSRNSIYSLYLKNSLNCLLCSSTWEPENYGCETKDQITESSSKTTKGTLKQSDTDSELSETNSHNEEEDIWDKMEVVGNKKRSKATERHGPKSKVAKRQ